jgi:hypothetical protein
MTTLGLAVGNATLTPTTLPPQRSFSMNSGPLAKRYLSFCLRHEDMYMFFVRWDGDEYLAFDTKGAELMMWLFSRFGECQSGAADCLNFHYGGVAGEIFCAA